MKKFTKIIQLLMIIFLSSSLAFAQTNPTIYTGEMSKGQVPSYQRDNILWDQMYNPQEGSVTSQDFDGGLDAYDNQAADDFEVPDGVVWSITSLDIVGVYSSSATGPFDVVNVYFYDNNSSGQPGDEIASYMGIPSVDDGAGNLTIDLPNSGQMLSTGHYWVSVQVVGYVDIGQWFWTSHSGPQKLEKFNWRNPGDGFGTGFTDWVPGDQMWSFDNYDLSFALYGNTAVESYVQVGEGTSIETYVPAYGYYEYSWSAAIYLQSELGGPKGIEKLAYQTNNDAPTYQFQNQFVYMKHTTATDFSGNLAYEDPSDPANGYTQVYTGDVAMNGNQWNLVDLSTTFDYNGTDNLIIAWDNMEGNYNSPYPHYYYTSSPNRAKYNYSDGSFPSGDASSASDYVPNTRFYYFVSSGTLEGTVTNALTGDPIIGAEVSAGSSSTLTLGPDGSYSMSINPGDYDVTCSLEGYESETQTATIESGETTTLDFQLNESAVPPAGPVTAELVPVDNDNVLIRWGLPGGSYEIIYDDGGAENITAWMQEGNMNALRFTPAGYPCIVQGGKINIGDGTYPPGDNLQPFDVAVYDDDGENGYPGTELQRITVTPTDYGWVEFSGFNDTIPDGDFYIVMIQGGDFPDCAGLAVDETAPVMRSYSRFVTGGAPWSPAGYTDFMIRAIVSGPGFSGSLSDIDQKYMPVSRISEGSVFQKQPPRTASGKVGIAKYVPIDNGKTGDSRDILGFKIWRLTQGQENDPDLWTVVGETTDTQITDDSWESLPAGAYLWAVESKYSGDRYSIPVFSNFIGKDWTAEVTVNVTLSSGDSPKGVLVTLTNNDSLPEHQYQATTDSTGIIVFPEVWKGNYNMTAYKFFYDLWEQDNFDIMGDMSIDVYLLETTMPPTALTVDGHTLIANWQAPGINLEILDEDWSSGSFATNEWTFDPGQGNWGIIGSGNPGPSAQFNWAPSQTNYSYALVSKELSGLGIPIVKLDFDIYLNNYSTSTTENMDVEVYDGTSWNLVKHYDNQGGSISWTSESVNITDYSNGPFRIRFRANGANSFNINWWWVDNIHVYGEISDTKNEKGVIGYNVYLKEQGAPQYMLVGYTSDTTYTYSDQNIVWGNWYTAAVSAIYASGPSDKSTYDFQSSYLPPPTEIAGEDIGHSADITWSNPQGGGAGYFEDFDEGEIPDGWIVNPSNEWSCEDTYLKMSGNSSGDYSTAYNDVDVFGNGVYEWSQIKQAGNQGYAMGLYILTDGTMNNGYRFTITANGYYLIIKYVNGSATWITPNWTSSSYINTGLGATNIGNIVVNNGDFQFSINGNFVKGFNDTQFPTGKALFYVYDKASEQVWFDYLSVMDLEEDMTINYYNNKNEKDPNARTVQGTESYCAGPMINNPHVPLHRLNIVYNNRDAQYGPLIGYKVYRGDTEDNLSMIDSTDEETFEYIDDNNGTGLQGGKSYYYAVTAVYGDTTPGESMYDGPIDVYIHGNGTLSGTVSEYGSIPTPIVGANITAVNVETEETYTATSGAGGSYSVAVVEGTYDVACSAEGYVNDTVTGVFVPDQGVGTADFQLLEMPYPALGVNAERNFTHTECDISWYAPNQFYWIIYDDGTAENVTAWDLEKNMNAVRFTPSAYPCQIFGGEINIYDGTWPPGNVLTPFQVAIYDDDGEGGLPGTMLSDLIDITPTDYGWVEFNLPGTVSIDDGDFYIVMIQGGDFPNCAPIAIDESNPVYRSYSKYETGGKDWELSGFADFMMRAKVYTVTKGMTTLTSKENVVNVGTPSEHAKTLNPPTVIAGTHKVGFGKFVDNNDNSRVIEHYEIYRLLQGDEGNPDNWTLLSDNITGTSYADTDWPSLVKGYYEYAVVAVYTYNQSEPVFSNAVPKGYDAEVTVVLSTDNNRSPEGAYILFTNKDGQAEHVYDSVVPENAPDTVSILFHELWKGYYDISVTKPGYYPYELLNVKIDNDKTFNVQLHEAALPPIQFTVNQDAIATWLPPVVEMSTVFEEGFEGGIIPSGWTQETDPNKNQIYWNVQTGGSSGQPDHAHGGTYNAVFSGSSATTKLITPVINLNNAIIPTLTFWHTQPKASGQDKLNVYYKNSPVGEWVPLKSYVGDIQNWRRETISLPNPSLNYYIAFEADAPDPAGQCVTLDDVKVEVGVSPYNKNRNLTGYDLYLDGNFIANVDADVNTLDYKDYVELSVGQLYIAGIQAVYTGGKSIMVLYPFTYYPCENLNPPRNIQGSAEFNTVTLTWDMPAGGGEPVVYDIIYDDGNVNNALSWNTAGGEFAERFTPSGYPCAVLSTTINIWDGTWPSGFDYQDFDVIIYDDDGDNGFPGTVLKQINYTPEDVNWVTVSLIGDGDTVKIPDGDFYISHVQNQSYPNNTPQGLCEGSPAYRSYSRVAGGDFYLEQDYAEYAIRATVYSPTFGTKTIGPDVPQTINVTNGKLSDKAVSLNKPIVHTGTHTIGTGKLVASDGSIITRQALKGFNVYRDGERRNSEPLTSLEYTEEVHPGGTYYYAVTAVYDVGESCQNEFPIQVGTELNPPTDLTDSVGNYHDVYLTWRSPVQAEEWWLSYCSNNYSTNIGAGEVTFDVAIRFEPSQLVSLDGKLLTEIWMVASDTGKNSTYRARIWTGENAANMIVDQPITDLVWGEWNNIVLTTPVTIDASQELWIGYDIVESADDYAGAADEGPAVAGYGDMIYYNNVWQSMMQAYGLDYNWMIMGHVVNPEKGESYTLSPITNETNYVSLGKPASILSNSNNLIDPSLNNDRQVLYAYNVYRNGELDTTVTDTFCVRYGVPRGVYEYGVSAVYDEGESVMAGPDTVETGEPMLPPMNLTASVECFDVHLEWDTLNEILLSQNDGTPNNAYYQIFHYGYGVVFDLTDYPDAVLDKMEFRHSPWGLTGPFQYKIHVVDWDTYEEMAVIGPLTTTVEDDWETDIDLGSIVGNGGLVGVFMEPMSNDSTDAYPCMDFDASLDGSSMVGPLDDYTSFDAADGDFLLNLWIRTGYGETISARKVKVSELTNERTRKEVSNNTFNGDITINQKGTMNDSRSRIGFNVYRDGSKLNSEVLTDMFYDDLGLTPGDYSYTVKSVYTDGESEPAGPVDVTIGTYAPPINFVAYPDTLTNSIQLLWSAPEGGDLVGFNVYRDEIQINENVITDTSYLDYNLPNGTYLYYVTAVYSQCESLPTDTISVTLKWEGVNEFDNMVSIYPNPASNYVYITVNNNIRNIKIYSNIGQLVYENNIVKNKTIKLNTAVYKAGTYMIQFRTNNGKTINKKIVIIN